ncbi:hypothetical protein Vadar_011340 [Vaccinium darrowii]|uniref:Uncharacterized protein n=1 Tax=Vaccinium darrowii TaxID=229202 RepID=A0ACB7YUL9_9ERIC|nr:hypothetical protein Vadar_011340 [Vaccinium darrowii]
MGVSCWWVWGLMLISNLSPFAYAIVESETKDSWIWFLELVTEDLQIVNNSAWTFISDKLKKSNSALGTCMPTSQTCTGGIELRKQLWVAARATTVQDFDKVMPTMKETDVEAFNWLAEKPPRQWSRSYYCTLNKCDLLVNNLCEGFNKDIKVARDKPIITMLEGIRCYLMKRMTTRKKKITEWENNICPNIIDKVEKYKKKCGSNGIPAQASHAISGKGRGRGTRGGRGNDSGTRGGRGKGGGSRAGRGRRGGSRGGRGQSGATYSNARCQPYWDTSCREASKLGTQAKSLPEIGEVAPYGWMLGAQAKGLRKVHELARDDVTRDDVVGDDSSLTLIMEKSRDMA